MQHLIRLADVLMVCDSRKTLSNLYRQFVEELDPKTAADFFRESPWAPEDVDAVPGTCGKMLSKV